MNNAAYIILHPILFTLSSIITYISICIFSSPRYLPVWLLVHTLMW